MGLNLFTMFSDKPKPSKQQQGKPGEKTPAQVLAEGMLNVRDIIAPSAIEVDFTFLRIGNVYFRTIFVSGYPRFVGANWLSPIINFEHTLDVSMFYYPVKSKVILDDLRRKITELEATTMTNVEKGKIVDPVVSAALEDAKALQEQLVKGVEKYFQFSFYITISAETLEDATLLDCNFSASGPLPSPERSASRPLPNTSDILFKFDYPAHNALCAG